MGEGYENATAPGAPVLKRRCNANERGATVDMTVEVCVLAPAGPRRSTSNERRGDQEGFYSGNVTNVGRRAVKTLHSSTLLLNYAAQAFYNLTD